MLCETEFIVEDVRIKNGQNYAYIGIKLQNVTQW